MYILDIELITSYEGDLINCLMVTVQIPSVASIDYRVRNKGVSVFYGDTQGPDAVTGGIQGLKWSDFLVDSQTS